MFRINSSISLASYRSSFQTWQRHASRLSHGKRILSAADDAAGQSISTKLLSQLRGKRMQVRNLQDQISMLQTADGGMNESMALLQRLRELAVSSGSPALSPADVEAKQMEAMALLDGLRAIAATTHFNHKPLLDKQVITHTERRTAEQPLGPSASLLGEPTAVGTLTGADFYKGSIVTDPVSGLITYKSQAASSWNKTVIYNPQTNTKTTAPMQAQATGTTGSWVHGGQSTYLVVNEHVSSTSTYQPVIFTVPSTSANPSRQTLYGITNMKGSPVTGTTGSVMWAAFTRGNQTNSSNDSLWLVDVAAELAGQPKRLQWDEQPGALVPITFDSTGQSLYIQQYDGVNTTIWELNVTGDGITTKRNVATLSGQYNVQKASPDKQSLALRSTSGLFNVDLATGNVKQLASGDIMDVTWVDDNHLASVGASGISLHSVTGESRLIMQSSTPYTTTIAADAEGNLMYCTGTSAPLLKVDVNLDTSYYPLEHQPVGDVTLNGASVPVAAGSVYLDWTNKPLSAQNASIVYEYDHTWQEDISEPLLVDGSATLSASNVTPEALGLTSWLNGSWSSSQSVALQEIDRAIQTLSSDRAAMGAWSNRLEHRSSGEEISIENHIASYSQISDADMAWETWQAAKAAAQLQISINVTQQAARMRASALDLLFTGNLQKHLLS